MPLIPPPPPPPPPPYICHIGCLGLLDLLKANQKQKHYSGKSSPVKTVQPYRQRKHCQYCILVSWECLDLPSKQQSTSPVFYIQVCVCVVCVCVVCVCVCVCVCVDVCLQLYSTFGSLVFVVIQV